MSFLSNQPENVNSKQGPGRNSLIRRAAAREQSRSPREGWAHAPPGVPENRHQGYGSEEVPLSVEVPARSGHHWGGTGLRRRHLSATPLLCIRLCCGCQRPGSGWAPPWLTAGLSDCWLVALGGERQGAGKNVAGDRRQFQRPHPLASQFSGFRWESCEAERWPPREACRCRCDFCSPLDLALCFSPRPPLELGDQGSGRITCQRHSRALNPSAGSQSSLTCSRLHSA